jgi:hypothetical protein
MGTPMTRSSASGVLEAETRFLEKPVHAPAFAFKVREVLDTD